MADQNQAQDPFGSGGGGLYGGTMIGGVQTRRKHISERGVRVDGSPLKEDPLATLKRSRDRLQAQVDELAAQMAAIEAQIEDLASRQEKPARKPPRGGKPAPRKITAPPVEPTDDDAPADESEPADV